MPIILPSRYQNAATRTADMTQDMIDLSNVVTQINAGSSPNLPLTLDAMDTTASIAVPTTPTVFTCPTVNTAQNIAFDPVTGIVTVTQGGNYQVAILLNFFPTALTTLFYALEVDFGSGSFVAVPTSGRQVSRNVNINGQVTFVSNSFLSTGLRARIYIWASAGGATFQTIAQTPLPGGPSSVVATRIQVTGV